MSHYDKCCIGFRARACDDGYGGSYYVWVTENMTVTEKGSTENTVDHRVYRLEPSGSGYIIADYTSDPMYKG